MTKRNIILLYRLVCLILTGNKGDTDLAWTIFKFFMTGFILTSIWGFIDTNFSKSITSQGILLSMVSVCIWSLIIGRAVMFAWSVLKLGYSCVKPIAVYYWDTIPDDKNSKRESEFYIYEDKKKPKRTMRFTDGEIGYIIEDDDLPPLKEKQKQGNTWS